MGYRKEQVWTIDIRTMKMHITLNKLMRHVVWWADSIDLSKEHAFSFCRLNPEDGGTIFFRNDGIQPPQCTESQVKRTQHKTSRPLKAQTYNTRQKNLKNMENVSDDKKNQLDVTFCIPYFSSNSCSTCFGQPCAHHQELTTAWCYSLVLVCAVAAGRLSRPVGR